MKFVIVGSGPAGIVASHMIKKLEPKSSVTLIGKEPNIVVRCSEPYAIAGVIELKDIIKPDEIITSANVEFIREEVVELDRVRRTVKTKSGREFEYDYLILTTGSKPFIPPIPGVDKENVFTLRTADDARRIREALEQAEHVIIIGGGMIGVELASLLADKYRVTVLELLPKILYASYDDEFCDEVESALRARGVDILTGRKVEEIIGENRASGVVAGGEKIKGDIVLVLTGVRPEVTLAQRAGIEIGKFGIKTDEHMKTSAERVYAAGDCTESFSAITKKPMPSALVSTAIAQAKVAAMNVCGREARFEGVINPSVTKIFDLSLGRVGLTERGAKEEGIKTLIGKFEGLTKYDTQKDAKPLKLKLVFNSDKVLIGGEVLASGNLVSPLIDFLSFAILRKLTPEDLKTIRYPAHPELTCLPFFHPIVSASERVV